MFVFCAIQDLLLPLCSSTIQLGTSKATQKALDIEMTQTHAKVGSDLSDIHHSRGPSLTAEASPVESPISATTSPPLLPKVRSKTLHLPPDMVLGAFPKVRSKTLHLPLRGDELALSHKRSRSSGRYANEVYTAINETVLGRSYSRIRIQCSSPAPSPALEIKRNVSFLVVPQSSEGPELSISKSEALVAESEYIGEVEDNKWMEFIPQYNHILEEEMSDDRKDKNKEFYNRLLSGMQIFRYQNA